MAEQLASVPEETTDGFSAPCPQPSSSYSESIRSVAGPRWRVRSTLSSESDQSGSNYSSNSGTSSSYISDISGCSSGSASAGAAAGAKELTEIACRMISDGYTQRIVRAFKCGGEHCRALETWFMELDINWVLQMGDKDGWEFQFQHKSASCLQELVERWTRALTIIVVSIKELVVDLNEAPAIGKFGKASISAMLVFVDAIVNAYNAKKKLQAVLHMYISVSNASYDILTMQVISSDAQRILNKIGGLLKRKGKGLFGAISETTRDLRWTLNGNNDTWAIEITRGGGKVHRNIRFLVECIVSMRKAQTSTEKYAKSDSSGTLRDLIDETLSYLKKLLLKKSKVCPDPSLRYMFLLNNSYFIAQLSEPSISSDVELFSVHHWGLKLMPECEKHMDSYLEVSWQDVMSYLLPSNFCGPLRHLVNESSLAKFQSAFHKTYRLQKFWKVPDPRIRSLLRKTITKIVISGYRNYLKEHPDLEKQVSGGRSSPEVFEEMLGELFEG